MIGVTLDSPSDSWVPTHGATSVPSMPAFPGSLILLCYITLLLVATQNTTISSVPYQATLLKVQLKQRICYQYSILLYSINSS